MTKKQVQAINRKLKAGEISLAPLPQEPSVPVNRSALEAEVVPQLKKRLNKKGFTYAVMDKMKKKEIIDKLLESTVQKVKPLDLASDIEAYLANGGQIVEVKGERNPRRKPPTYQSAEKNHVDKSAKRKKKSKTKKKAVPGIRAFGLSPRNLAEQLDVKPSKVRKLLRSLDITKPGSQWIWTDEKEFKKVLNQLKKEI